MLRQPRYDKSTLSTHSQQENQVTGTIPSILEHLGTSLVEDILKTALDEYGLSVVTFQSQYVAELLAILSPDENESTAVRVTDNEQVVWINFDTLVSTLEALISRDESVSTEQTRSLVMPASRSAVLPPF